MQLNCGILANTMVVILAPPPPQLISHFEQVKVVTENCGVIGTRWLTYVVQCRVFALRS